MEMTFLIYTVLIILVITFFLLRNYSPWSIRSIIAGHEINIKYRALQRTFERMKSEVIVDGVINMSTGKDSPQDPKYFEYLASLEKQLHKTIEEFLRLTERYKHNKKLVFEIASDTRDYTYSLMNYLNSDDFRSSIDNLQLKETDLNLITMDEVKSRFRKLLKDKK